MSMRPHLLVRRLLALLDLHVHGSGERCMHAHAHAPCRHTHRRAVALDDVEDLAHALLLDLGFRDVGPVLQGGVGG